MQKFIDLFRGLTTAPWLVGLARGVLEAAVIAAIAAAATVVGVHVPPELQVGFWAVIRTIEGIADQIDPTKQRAVEVARAGG